jgi:hypothetical protein
VADATTADATTADATTADAKSNLPEAGAGDSGTDGSPATTDSGGDGAPVNTCGDAGEPQADSWSFGVIGDTQWPTTTDEAQNPNAEPVSIINQTNAALVAQGVRFVVQVGDLIGDSSSNKATQDNPTDRASIDTRATYAQALYNANIGFFPVRGNHEPFAFEADEFKTVFPQTQNGGNNSTPLSAFGAHGDADAGLVPKYGSSFVVGSNFDSPKADGGPSKWQGLTYSFDYANVRFLLLDQYDQDDDKTNPDASVNHNIASQESWIDSTLSGRPQGSHAFVFSHKGLITEEHVDVLLGSTPAENPDDQNAFMASLQANGVHYLIHGHDHMHDRARVVSPDQKSSVTTLTAAANSWYMYTPCNNTVVPDGGAKNVCKDSAGNVIQPSVDQYFNPPNGRKTLLAQDLYKVGYYVVSVSGPQVTVAYYASDDNAVQDPGDQSQWILPASPLLTFTGPRDTFGYSQNGKEFVIAQGASYSSIADSYQQTRAAVLDGTNKNILTSVTGRPFSKAVDTGWAPRTCATASDALTLWGMANQVDSAVGDVYVLSMTYDAQSVSDDRARGGKVGLVTKQNGHWVNAVDANLESSSQKHFTVGAYDPSSNFKLGTFGIDPLAHTAWAVIDYGSASTFAVSDLP